MFRLMVLLATLLVAGCTGTQPAAEDPAPASSQQAAPGLVDTLDAEWTYDAAARVAYAHVNYPLPIREFPEVTFTLPDNATAFVAVSEWTCPETTACKLRMAALQGEDSHSHVDGDGTVELAVNNASGEWTLRMVAEEDPSVAVGAEGQFHIMMYTAAPDG